MSHLWEYVITEDLIALGWDALSAKRFSRLAFSSFLAAPELDDACSKANNKSLDQPAEPVPCLLHLFHSAYGTSPLPCTFSHHWSILFLCFLFFIPRIWSHVSCACLLVTVSSATFSCSFCLPLPRHQHADVFRIFLLFYLRLAKGNVLQVIRVRS